MAEKLIHIDRTTPMLLPPDLRDWVEDDDLVHFILNVVTQVPHHHASVNPRGTGSAQYPPGAMLALLLYCYSQGIYSSRRICRRLTPSTNTRLRISLHCSILRYMLHG